MCSQGYTVSESETNTFWAGDLLHRLYHMPAIGQGLVQHFADGYEGVLEMAGGNSTESVRDSETLQYFALEVYAYDVAIPGVGCVGRHGSQEQGQDGQGQDGQNEQEESGQQDSEEEIPDVCPPIMKTTLTNRTATPTKEESCTASRTVHGQKVITSIIYL